MPENSPSFPRVSVPPDTPDPPSPTPIVITVPGTNSCVDVLKPPAPPPPPPPPPLPPPPTIKNSISTGPAPEVNPNPFADPAPRVVIKGLTKSP